VQPDLPGYGHNRDRRCSGFDDCVERLIHAVQDVDVLVGWSLGGLLAMSWADRVPPRRLVLIGASARFTQAADWPHGMTRERFDAFSGDVDEHPLTARKRFAALATMGDVDARAARSAMAALIGAAPDPAPDVLKQGLEWLRDQDLRRRDCRASVRRHASARRAGSRDRCGIGGSVRRDRECALGVRARRCASAVAAGRSVRTLRVGMSGDG
jgi:pimeloyl-ACP methyl ester carboxylesterase